MKGKYIGNSGDVIKSFTKDNWYEFIDIQKEYNYLVVEVIDDFGSITHMRKSDFMTLQEIRNNKINNLLNE